MAEDEYALTRGKIVTFIGILFVIIGLMGFILVNFVTGFTTDSCIVGYCTHYNFFQAFISEFYYNFTYNLLFLAFIAFGISFIFIGWHLDKPLT
jgi:hypothetical protein